MTDRYAVIGNPVGHSLSPAIHAEFARATGEDLTYGTLEAPVGGFAQVAGRFLDTGKGLNVTVPFKLDAWRWVDRHDAHAAAAGAVNTIVPATDGWLGCNTDGLGLVKDLTEHLGWQVAGARTLILGAGGAVQGVIGALKEAGAEGVVIANRTVTKGQALAQEFGVGACSLDKVGDGWDLVVNGTSAGLAGTGELIAAEAVADACCYDLLYRRDGATPFCAWARARGARAVADGLGMLVEQAAHAFYLWRGVRPDTVPVLALIRGGSPS